MKLQGLLGKGPNRSRRNAEPESPAGEEQVMEEVCGRENCQRALRRVKSNKGRPWRQRQRRGVQPPAYSFDRHSPPWRRAMR